MTQLNCEVEFLILAQSSKCMVTVVLPKQGLDFINQLCHFRICSFFGSTISQNGPDRPSTILWNHRQQPQLLSISSLLMPFLSILCDQAGLLKAIIYAHNSCSSIIDSSMQQHSQAWAWTATCPFNFLPCLSDMPCD